MNKKQCIVFLSLSFVLFLFPSEQKEIPKKTQHADVAKVPESTPPQAVPAGEGSGKLRLSASDQQEEEQLSAEDYFKKRLEEEEQVTAEDYFKKRLGLK